MQEADWLMVAHAENLEILLGAALSKMDEAIAVLDAESRVVFWNPAAEAITGHLSADLLARRFPTDLYQVDAGRRMLAETGTGLQAVRRVERRTTPRTDPEAGVPVLVTLRHSRGHALPGMLRSTPLRDAVGKRFGTLLRFHPVEEIDALPHGEMGREEDQNSRVEESQSAMEDRLDEAWQEWKHGTVPFGLLWITVDQAAMLRKTHGQDASEAMLAIVERTLLHGLKPTEILGRWGSNEFLVLAHERSAEMLQAHAQHLADLASKADFRWWGDRVPLTVSVGAAQACEGTSLSSVLRLAQKAMQASTLAGGNHGSDARGQECSQL